jgi:pyruvate carboxylase
MYPEVFAEYTRFTRDFGRVSILPTFPYFYGLKPGEEMSVEIETGKTLYVKLLNVGAPDKDGLRTVTFELNGMAREATVLDRSIQTKVKARPKADPADPMQIGAPIPGIITALAVGVGTKVSKNDKLLTLEAMKMQSTLYAPADGVVNALHVQVGDTVESKSLLLELRAK